MYKETGSEVICRVVPWNSTGEAAGTCRHGSRWRRQSVLVLSGQGARVQHVVLHGAGGPQRVRKQDRMVAAEG